MDTARFGCRLPRLLAVLLMLASSVLLAPATSAPAADDGADIVPGFVVVKLRANRSSAALRASAERLGALEVDERPALGAQLWRVGVGTERMIAEQARASPEVEYAEPDRIKRSTLIPNDTYYGRFQWNLPKINMPRAWDVTAGDPGVKVAVIDSGFDLGHEDRPAYLEVGCDYVTWGSPRSLAACPRVVDDANGHGTHVGGIVAARQNNSLGISGIAPHVTLLVIRTAGENGASRGSDVAEAIREATDRGARVINLSLAGPSATRTEQDAVTYALGRGVVVVAAAGNEYASGNATAYPAAFAGVIAVGAASDDDRHSYFSNTGRYLSLVAPGGSATDVNDSDPRHWIASLYPTSRGKYQLVEGTSQAAPHVAAVAGLMISANSTLSGSTVAAVLRSTARPIGSPIPNETFGYGYLDAEAAVKAARAAAATATPTPPPSPTATATPTPTPPCPTPSVSPTAIALPTSGPSAQRAFIPLSPRTCLVR